MARARSFSIYLLKNTYTPDNALKDDNNLELVDGAEADLPRGAILYIADKHPNDPWWKSYWGISRDLYQVQKGAIVFLPVSNNWFAMTFGMTYHQLKDTAYEYDFGLLTTLNALDPERIKSTDFIQPESARRQRVQSPIASSLNFFDIRHDEAILKKLTGSVKEDYKEWFKNATGASSLRISTKLSSNQITDLLEELIQIYNNESYKTSFPDIRNIEPVRDPEKLETLNTKLVMAFSEETPELVLAKPEIIDYSNALFIKYSGAGKSSLQFDDVYIFGYREYLNERNIQINEVAQFHGHQMHIIDENGYRIKNFNIFKCFLFDCQLGDQHYHLCEGEWYSIAPDFLSKIETSLNRHFLDEHDFLRNCVEKLEGDYNSAIARENDKVYCLDRQNISPIGQTAVEPSDLLAVIDNKINFIHVKISTRSASLSHLFNQGITPVELLRVEEQSREKLKELVNNDTEISRLIEEQKFEVTFGIITKKNKENKVINLPIFSRISLLRTVKYLTVMGIGCSIFYIFDEVERKSPS